VCIGIDPVVERLPEILRRDNRTDSPGGALDAICEFTEILLDAVADVVPAVKFQAACFERYREDGVEAMYALIGEATERGLIVVLDAKRGDIGHTCAAYARAIFDHLGADAVTLNPYLGREALAPFLERADRGCFILCRTSNPGAGEFQDLLVAGRPLYQIVAGRVGTWNERGNCGLVVGATFPAELAQVRRLCPDLPMLIPGVGAQGGDLELAVRAGVNAAGQGILVNVSRGVLYASAGPDFAEAAARVARDLSLAIDRAREPGGVEAV